MQPGTMICGNVRLVPEAEVKIYTLGDGLWPKIAAYLDFLGVRFGDR